MRPLVTVHICTYNRANTIKKALDSVISQTYKNLQILIVDDASSDNTEEIVRKYSDDRIEYYKNESNLGITKNRNKALSLSKGKYIAVLDSDDYWIDENKISDQVNFLEKNPAYALVGTYTNIADENGGLIKKLQPETLDREIRQKMLMSNQFSHSSVVYRKDTLEKYNDKYFIWEDYAAWLEIGSKYKFANLPITTTNYTRHSGNISKDKKIKGIVTLGEIIADNKNNYSNFYLASLKNKIRLLKTILGL